jgi:methyl-accepting chemotaxis protein
MADVTVEFGATDTGLEKTLKAVQDELTQLKGKVSSGELSMTELESTMKRIGQVESMEKRIKSIGDASSESSPKIKNLGDSIESTGDKTKNVGGIFDEEFKRMGAAFTAGNLAAEGFQKAISIVFDAATKVVQGFSEALDLGGRLSELSAQTGEAAGTLLVLEAAFKNSGLEADQVGTAINKLQNFMVDAADEGSRQANAMDDLGIAMADLKGKTPTEQMEVFAQKIASIEDPTQRAATASEVFGEKLGGKLLPVLVDFSGNIEDARSKVGSLEQVMNENADTFDKFSESIEAVKGKMAAFAAGVLSETVPALQELGSEMEGIDAARIGQEIGTILNPAISELATILKDVTGEYGEYYNAVQSASMGNADAANSSKDATGMLDLLKAMMVSITGPISDLVSGTTDYTDAANAQQDAVKKAGDASSSAADNIKNLSNSSSEATQGMNDVADASDKATPAVQNLGDEAKGAGEKIDTAFTLTADLKPELDSIGTGWKDVGDNIGTSNSLLEGTSEAFGAITQSTEDQVAGLEGVNDQLTTSQDLTKLIDYTYGEHADKLEEIQAKNKEIADKEVERQANLQKLLNYEVQIAEAQAAGDSERVKALQEQKKYADDFARAIAAGMDKEQATDFADRIAQAASNSRNIVTTDKDGNPLFFESAKAAQNMSENLASATGFAQTLANMKQIEALEKANNTAKSARLELKAMDQILGTDLANKSFPDLVKKLNIDKLGQTGSEQIEAVVDYMNGVKMKLSQNPIDSKAGKSAIDEVKNSINKSPFKGKLAMDSSEAKENTKTAFSKFTTTLDAEKSVKGIRDSVKDGIEVDVAAKSGVNGILDQIKGFVETIKETVVTLEKKLPVAALI